MTEYFSALRDPATEWPSLSFHKGERGDSFQADISKGIPAAMYKADIWYAEPPWRHGFHKFADRARVSQQMSYEQMLEILKVAIKGSGIPTVLVTGRHAINKLDAEDVAMIKLNGYVAVAGLWGVAAWNDVPDTVEVLSRLAEQYKCIGDFCCGYGKAGRIFAEAGRRYIMSDLNPQCIGYIAAHEKDWR